MLQQAFTSKTLPAKLRHREEVIPHIERELKGNPSLGFLEVLLPCRLDGELEHALTVVTKENRASFNLAYTTDGTYLEVTRHLPAL